MAIFFVKVLVHITSDFKSTVKVALMLAIALALLAAFYFSFEYFEINEDLLNSGEALLAQGNALAMIFSVGTAAVIEILRSIA